MSVNELLRAFREAENTPEYQFEKAVVDLTEQLCEIMEAKGISRADLARQLGKSRAWVTKVLRGDQNLTLKTITDIFWELGYAARVEAEPRWGRSADWDQDWGEYASRDVVTVCTQAGRRAESGSQYIDQPIAEPTEKDNAVAA